MGTQQILDQMRDFAAAAGGPVVHSADGKKLALLPGTPYARFALPLEYTPSRDYRPRYGYSHPPIRALEDWFAANVEEYSHFLTYLRSIDLTHIPVSANGSGSGQPAWTGGAICAFDSLALYGMVLKHSPRRYLEIGSGMTTCFARQAIIDGKLPTRIASIDPEPRAEIDAICDETIRDGLETCDIALFDELEPNDILFFDGSHRSFMNSDVTVFFLEVLPRLKPGVIVHIHDVHLPWDYPEWAKDWYWNEQYLLAVYMLGNRARIRVLLPTAYVCRATAFGELLRSPFVDLGRHNDSWRGGGSMWFTHG